MRVARPSSTTKSHSPRLPDSTNACGVSGTSGLKWPGSRPPTRRPSRSATVKAETDVHGYQLPVWSFRPIVESHPEMVWALLESLAQRVREAEGRSAADGS